MTGGATGQSQDLCQAARAMSTRSAYPLKLHASGTCSERLLSPLMVLLVRLTLIHASGTRWESGGIPCCMAHEARGQHESIEGGMGQGFFAPHLCDRIDAPRSYQWGRSKTSVAHQAS